MDSRLVHSPEGGLIPTAPVPTNVADILTAAAEIVSKPGAWTQGGFARNARGTLVRIFAPEAVCFCAVGAIERASGERPHPSYGVIRAMDFLSEVARCGANIGNWNDDARRTQAEVVAALRAAAEKARTASSVGTSGASAPSSPNPGASNEG